jgi:hypothetical protein
MDGIIAGRGWAPSKKAVKAAVADGTARIVSTSLFGGYSGPVTDAPDGTYTFVGPDPYTSRKFYGTITVRDGKAAVK